VPIPEFADTLGRQRDALISSHGAQHNDPRKGAEAILTALAADIPPRHLLLGADALALARQQLVALADTFDAWEEVTCGTEFD
jgi:hypothetical protein